MVFCSSQITCLLFIKRLEAVFPSLREESNVGSRHLQANDHDKSCGKQVQISNIKFQCLVRQDIISLGYVFKIDFYSVLSFYLCFVFSFVRLSNKIIKSLAVRWPQGDSNRNSNLDSIIIH